MSHHGNQPYGGRPGKWLSMLGTWEESLGHECPTMETSPIMVDRDDGSACWTLGREV